MLLAFISVTSGLILETAAPGRREAKRMSYLAVGHRATDSDARETGVADR